MPNFRNITPAEFMKQRKFTAAIPGQSMTIRPKSLPYDRPPAFPKADELLSKVFDGLMEPKRARDMLALLEGGMPVDTLAASMMSHFVGEGITTPQAGMIALPATAVMMMRMADAAEIDFVPTAEDIRKDSFSPAEIFGAEQKVSKDRLAGKAIKEIERSSKELSNLPTTEAGLLKKPEELI